MHTVWVVSELCVEENLANPQRRQIILVHLPDQHGIQIVIRMAQPAFALAFGLAPRAESKDKGRAKITGQTITATGCLTKEAKEKNEYLITGEDGKTRGVYIESRIADCIAAETL